MKYFHGSRSRFKEFTQQGSGKHGDGFYFTADESEARVYAKTLYGNGTDLTPTVYQVLLRVSNPLNTMNIDHCQLVMESIGQKFKPNKNAGGAKEQYYYLCRQLKAWGISNPNEAIRLAGFDALYWEFGEHMVVFDSKNIQIEDFYSVD